MGELKALFIVGTSCKKRASGGIVKSEERIVKSEASRYLELGMWES
ncbi:hypothetical protein [Capnocytophaga granulosa]